MVEAINGRMLKIYPDHMLTDVGVFSNPDTTISGSGLRTNHDPCKSIAPRGVGI